MIKKENIIFAPYDKVLKYIIPYIPKKVTPNHLTFIRLAFSPIVLVLLVGEEYLTGLFLFVILAITDMFDGSMARLRNQITTWGKIWDPVADKLLIGIVVVALLLKINLSLTILLLAFELAFILGGVFSRINEVDIQANIWGKIKMNLQCLGAVLLILGFSLSLGWLIFLAQIILYFSVGFALISILNKGI